MPDYPAKSRQIPPKSKLLVRCTCCIMEDHSTSKLVVFTNNPLQPLQLPGILPCDAEVTGEHGRNLRQLNVRGGVIRLAGGDCCGSVTKLGAAGGGVEQPHNTPRHNTIGISFGIDMKRYLADHSLNLGLDRLVAGRR